MTDAARRPPRGLARASIIGASLALVALFMALGIWQVERRAWKHRLIATVAARIHAPPVPPPGIARWDGLSQASDGYRRVRATGQYLHIHDSFVRATTERGSGYWVMTPFETGTFILLVNRGFVPADQRETTPRAPVGLTSVTGLLRLSEPGGGFLRANDPGADRWYSRDVAAIARARRIGPVAPYFIDAEAGADPAAYPIGGLTVVRFPDNHLVYALTWFALAGLSGWGGWRVLRDGRDGDDGGAAAGR